jgi:predicted dithiol-disulfide oxidoreductase (DUF899 family)
MTSHRVGTQEEWQRERDALLAEEKELTRRGDELTRKRRELPWVPVEKNYTFATERGRQTLADLFDGRSQLVVYHFMFGPPYAAGCPVNSSIADAVDGVLPHLHARDVTLVFVSQAPLSKLQAYKRRMGWTFPWVSSAPDSSRVPRPMRGRGCTSTNVLSTGSTLRPVARSGRLPGRLATTPARRCTDGRQAG